MSITISVPYNSFLFDEIRNPGATVPAITEDWQARWALLGASPQKEEMMGSEKNLTAGWDQKKTYLKTQE